MKICFFVIDFRGKYHITSHNRFELSRLRKVSSYWNSEIRLHQSVANVIIWAPTLTDSTSFHLYIDFVLFLLEVGKNSLTTANKVRHSPFSYQIFAMQVKAAIQVYCMWENRIFAKTEQKYVRQSIFLSLWVDDSCDAKTYTVIAKQVTEGFIVFYRAFSNP